MGETFYCDDYEALTGRERDGSMPSDGPGTTRDTEAKVVEAPKKAAAKKTTRAETKKS